MRYFDRSSVPAPSSLTDAAGAGKAELISAREFYTKSPEKTYSFSAYKGTDVAETLRKLFNDKCAYCESTFRAVSPADIEHYRPKGRVKDEENHQGYWWLAADWENLLPCCIDCNRERHQDHVVQGTSPEDIAILRRDTLRTGFKMKNPVVSMFASK